MRTAAPAAALWVAVCAHALCAQLTVSVVQFDGAQPPTDALFIGAGRNDGVVRLYASEWGNKGYEWSYSSGGWTQQLVHTMTGMYFGTLVGSPRGDNVQRVYNAGWGLGGSQLIYESTWNNGWPAPVSISASAGRGAYLYQVVADGRNDGVLRLYASSEGTNAGVYEFTYSSGAWSVVQVRSGATGVFSIGDGRNDGVRRLYCVERGGTRVLEYTWNGSSWAEAVVYTTPGSSNGAAHVGDGRGDGVNRVYAWSARLYEFTWNGSSWNQQLVDAAVQPRYYLRTGRVRSDNRSRLYAASQGNGVYEYTWNGGTGQFTRVDGITAATGEIRIGDGRGDGLNRMYVTRGDRSPLAGAFAEVSDANPPPASGNSTPAEPPRHQRRRSSMDLFQRESRSAEVWLPAFGGNAILEIAALDGGMVGRQPVHGLAQRVCVRFPAPGTYLLRLQHGGSPLAVSHSVIP